MSKLILEINTDDKDKKLDALGEAIKSCPFCGSEDLDEEYSEVINVSRDGLTVDYQSGCIECSNCGGQSPFVECLGDEIEALSKKVVQGWNKRVKR